RHTRSDRDWSSDVCSSDLEVGPRLGLSRLQRRQAFLKERSIGREPLTSLQDGQQSALELSNSALVEFHRGPSLGNGGIRLPAASDRKSTRLNSSHDQISYA